MDYEFTLTGDMPLLMHADNVEASDDLMAWRKDPKNKSVSVPGDDRSPGWTWQTYLYHDGEHLAFPQECLMAALRSAGARVPGKGKSTFKALTQSGLVIATDFMEFTVNGEQIPVDPIFRLRDLPFKEQLTKVRAMGFDLMTKRAKVGTSKHVRVRPMFENWQIRGNISVRDMAITRDVLGQLFEIAGDFAGLGDWRPSAPSKPGPYGMFSSEVKPLAARRKSA